jgi:murein DD-endopeptidase MepM/ murein hydrolase activator NlpD
LAESRPQLSLPIACEPQRTCFIQSYVDTDQGTGARDYACGTATYNSHSGVDFRLLSAADVSKSVPVIASADGKVKGQRDGVTDVFFSEQKDKSVAGRECGNGVVLDHGDGWETQYCHMKQGSVAVKVGDDVKRGAKLGDVGYSGMADFAHVHLTVRHNGKTIDPFLPDAAEGTCQRDARGAGLWQPEVAQAFPYRQGQIIVAGFAGQPPKHEELEKDAAKVVALTTHSDALLVYARFINLAAGDIVRISVSGPSGQLVQSTLDPLERNKATYTAFAGKKRTQPAWMAGAYTGTVEVIREGAVVATTVANYDLR